ncbi:MAG: alpha/beta hydrolase fold [Acidimicrobiales bacterium]|nr:alpha/beta hydrolase fold [Acidimicrobiales bacterium]
MSSSQINHTHVNGIDIGYMREGSGPRLLFVNGSGATLAASGPMLSVYSRQFDLLAHDQRGLGETEAPAGPYTMAEYAADAAGIADAIGWDTYRVVGVSFGGMVAQELAATFPERIERLALVCTSPGGEGGASYPLHTLADKSDADRAAIGLRILDTRFTPEWLAEHEGDRMLAGVMADRTAVTKSAEVLRGERLQLEARSHHDVFDRLPNITCPTLVASGRYDGIAPPENGAAIAGQIPDAELRVYEGGHAFFFQDPQAMPDILAFLAG